jgi:hypothetical protein
MSLRTDGTRGGVTAYFALAFVCVDDDIVIGQPVRCIGASAAIRRAHELMKNYGTVGALALRKSDHEPDRLDILCACGDVPDGEHIYLANGWRVVAREEEWDGVDVVG